MVLRGIVGPPPAVPILSFLSPAEIVPEPSWEISCLKPVDASADAKVDMKRQFDEEDNHMRLYCWLVWQSGWCGPRIAVFSDRICRDYDRIRLS